MSDSDMPMASNSLSAVVFLSLALEVAASGACIDWPVLVRSGTVSAPLQAANVSAMTSVATVSRPALIVTGASRPEGHRQHAGERRQADSDVDPDKPPQPVDVASRRGA